MAGAGAPPRRFYALGVWYHPEKLEDRVPGNACRTTLQALLGGVAERENAEATSVHSIGDDIRCARHDEFSRFGFAPGMTEAGVLGKPFRRLEDALSQSACGRRLVLFDILRISMRLVWLFRTRLFA